MKKIRKKYSFKYHSVCIRLNLEKVFCRFIVTSYGYQTKPYLLCSDTSVEEENDDKTMSEVQQHLNDKSSFLVKLWCKTFLLLFLFHIGTDKRTRISVCDNNDWSYLLDFIDKCILYVVLSYRAYVTYWVPGEVLDCNF